MNEDIRLDIAAKILAGFASNSAVFAQNGMSGWGLVNCTEDTIAGYSLHLADALLKARYGPNEIKP